MAYPTKVDLEKWLKISDVLDEVQATIALDAAIEAVEDYCNRPTPGFTLATSATARLFSPLHRGSAGYPVAVGVYCPLYVDDIGDLTGLIVETGTDGVTWTATTAYVTGPSNALAKGRPVRELRAYWWPAHPLYDTVRVTAKWGWPSTPPSVTFAVLVLAARFFKRKDTPQGVLDFQDAGIIRVTTGDAEVTRLLDNFVRPS